MATTHPIAQATNRAPANGVRLGGVATHVWGANFASRFRALKRDVDRMNRKPPRTRRRRAARAERPAGPRLVRGRGLTRRRRGAGLARAAVYCLVAAAFFLMLWKSILLPFLAG